FERLQQFRHQLIDTEVCNRKFINADDFFLLIFIALEHGIEHVILSMPDPKFSTHAEIFFRRLEYFEGRWLIFGKLSADAFNFGIELLLIRSEEHTSELQSRENLV